MYILFDFFASAWGVIRSFILFIDSVGLTFIDNAYNLLVSAAAGFDETAIKTIAENVAKNVYIIIGIFALFRIAVILINTIINPDKLTDKESGFGNVLARFVITICLFVAVPFIFDMSREIQAEIMKNNYISKAIIGTDLTSGNPGQVLKDTAVRALIHPDERVANKNSDNKYTCINDNDPCKTAVESWNNDAGITTLTRFIGDYEEVDGENVYIYDYIPFVTLLVGGFMTYVLFSFAIDIAVRSVELLALEVLAPLFIVTYIDPKSSSSGPFKNWVKTCSKTFISLFIKIGIVCLMLLFMQNLSTLMGSMNSDNGAFLNLLMMIAILIFAKKAPKLIGDMIGVEGGLGELGIGKKLGGTALVGGALSKGLESAKKFTGQKAKNFGANRLRNTAARIGGMKEAHAQNSANKKALTNDGKLDRDAYKNSKQSLWKQGRAAAKNSRAANWGADSQGLLKDISTGYMGGRMNLNPAAESLADSLKFRAQAKGRAYNDKIGNTQEEIAKRADAAKKLKKASQMRMDPIKMVNGERNAKVDWQGYNEFKAAIGGDVMTERQAYTNDLRNKVLAEGGSFDDATGIATTKDGRTITWEEHKKTFTEAGQKDVTAFVTKNVQSQTEALKANVELRVSNDQKITECKTQIANLKANGVPATNEAITALQTQIANLKANGVPGTDEAITALETQIAQLEAQNETINDRNEDIIKKMQNSESSFTSAPHKCPGAVQVGNEYVTAVGKFVPNGTGFDYVPVASDVSSFNLDPTVINDIMNKVANVASSKSSEADEAHKAMEPKSS